MSYGKPHCYKTKIDELNREITELKNEAQLSDIAFDAMQETIEALRTGLRNANLIACLAPEGKALAVLNGQPPEPPE